MPSAGRRPIRARRILGNLWVFRDTCNVYVLKTGRRALAIDFGSGRWLSSLRALGIEGVDHVLLTHHHADQCAGLEARRARPFRIHAPQGEDAFLDPARIKEADRLERKQFYVPFPASYSRVTRGVGGIAYDVQGDSELFLNGLCLRCVHTPGHGPNACSYIVEFQGRQIAFCGDAVHAGGTIWQPYNLEWEHWTGKGALAAWEGICRLEGIGLDLLCPSHGPVVAQRPLAVLRRLDRRLLNFYRAKGSICAGEKDRWLVPEPLGGGVSRVLPHLYMGSGNAYLLHSENGEALIVDPTRSDIRQFERLLTGPLRGVRPTAALVSHAHTDHYEGVPYLQRRYHAQSWIHPRLAEAITAPAYRHGLYRARWPLRIDRLWPETGRWQWNEYTFEVAPWPGQTWWHCVFMATIDGQKVMFGGDSFQPASRWNGTGGFCSCNISRFRDGYIPSARLALRWKPDILANGHRCVFRFTAARFRRIIRWAHFAEKATLALCPSGDLEKDYYTRAGV